MQDVEYGYCHCGCGEKAPISPQTVRKLGYVKGEPRRYIRNHDKRDTGPQYKIDPETGCWLFLGYVGKKGYGSMRPRGSKTMRAAHIVYYEQAKGPVPAGLQVGHICHDNDTSCPGGVCKHRRCVNPDHLAVQTNTENQRGGRRPKLTIEIVREIRSRPQTYGSRLALAREFGIDPSTISKIRNQADRFWIDE